MAITAEERARLLALAGGCAIESTGTPALDATYHAQGPRWELMVKEAIFVAIFNEFSGGLAELDWDAQSGPVTFTTTAQFKAVAKAIFGWRTHWQRYVDGKDMDPPASPVTIA